MFATLTTNIGWILLTVLVLGWILYAWQNVRAGHDEIGSEVELAANRKPYYDDETLEGPKLERTQLLAVLFLGVLTLALPIYWIFEPQRAANAQNGWDKRFAKYGSHLFAPTADGGFNCAGCHGGMNATGGVAPFAITDAKTGEVKAVSWTAPALNTVLYRFSEDEVRFILTYGRPGSPMSPWGLAGGGPMNDQQITTIIEYLKSIQIKPEGCVSKDSFSAKADPAVCDGGMVPATISDEVEKAARDAMAAAEAAGAPITYGQALFNSTYSSGARGPNIREQAASWPTPAAHEARLGFQDRTRGTKGTQVSLSTVAMQTNWPTPAGRDYKGSNSSHHMNRTDGRTDGRSRNHADQLPNFVMYRFSHQDQTMNDGPTSLPKDPTSRRRLNPQFVDWMMGWPPGWTSTEPTDLDAEEMVSWHFKLDSHLSRLLAEPESLRRTA